MYIVVEVQKTLEGQIGTLVYSFTDQYQAESKYHDILAAAAVSELSVHSCIMFSDEGFPLRHECYKH